MAKQLTALRLDTELLDAARRVKAREGIPLTAQIELALPKWLTAKGGLKAVAPAKSKKKGTEHG